MSYMTEQIYSAPESNLTTRSSLDDREYAGFWVRCLASLIDAVLSLMIVTPILYLVYGKDYFLSDSMLQGPIDFAINYLLVPLIVVLFWVYQRVTPGKMLLGLEVVKADSDINLSFLNAVGRYLAYYLSAIVLFLGFITIAFDKRKQGWHDKLAGTVIVKKR